MTISLPLGPVMPVSVTRPPGAPARARRPGPGPLLRRLSLLSRCLGFRRLGRGCGLRPRPVPPPGRPGGVRPGSSSGLGLRVEPGDGPPPEPGGGSRGLVVEGLDVGDPGVVVHGRVPAGVPAAAAAAGLGALAAVGSPAAPGRDSRDFLVVEMHQLLHSSQASA